MASQTGCEIITVSVVAGSILALFPEKYKKGALHVQEPLKFNHLKQRREQYDHCKSPQYRKVRGKIEDWRGTLTGVPGVIWEIYQVNRGECGGKSSLEGKTRGSICYATFLVYFHTMASSAGLFPLTLGADVITVNASAAAAEVGYVW